MSNTVDLQLYTEDPLLHSVLLLFQCYEEVLILFQTSRSTGKSRVNKSNNAKLDSNL